MENKLTWEKLFIRQEKRRIDFIKKEIIKRNEQHKEEIARLRAKLKEAQENIKSI
jgi:hypothetical protein